MKKLQLPDGSYEFIENDEQLRRLIVDKLGNDIGNKIDRLIAEADYTERKIHTDLDCYESDLDSWNCVGNDIMDIVFKLEEHIDESKRINKSFILECLNSIRREINGIM